MDIVRARDKELIPGHPRKVVCAIPALFGGKMRFFFDVVDGRNTYSDEEGQDWPTAIAAGVCGARIARDLACEAGNLRFVVRITDERDHHVASIPVRQFA
jgi:hypothetical protein